MRIAIAQINPTLGDFEGNCQKILEYINRAKDHHCTLVVFPEASLCGYHPFDLLELHEFVRQQEKWLHWLLGKMPKGINALVGGFTHRRQKLGRPYFNSAFLIQQGKIQKVFHKTLLPTGDVFDEARFVENGDMGNNFVRLGGHKIFVTICEDIWAWPDKKGHSPYLQNPLGKLPKSKKVDLVINLSASPFHIEKMAQREWVVGQTARAMRAPMIYVNTVGAQDEVIYDGRSFFVGKDGKKISELLAHQEDFSVFDLAARKIPTARPKLAKVELLKEALVSGIRDFVEKNRFKKVHLGLSGGIDSALVAALAVQALGPHRVTTYYLPTRFSSALSEKLAVKLAQSLGTTHVTISIEEIFKKIDLDLTNSIKLGAFSVVHENIQSRLRGLVLMTIANQENSLLLATGNKSELAAGYSTLYGDLCGGLLPIGDLTKAEVVTLTKSFAEVIPAEIISRPPTAELRENQKDEDSLPPYAQLDKAVESFFNSGRFDRSEAGQWLKQAFFRHEFKRWQAPPILKVKSRSFGKGRRWPISHHFR